MARGDRIPIACTLTPSELPNRLEEWAALRREALIAADRSGAGATLRFRVDAEPAVRALIAAEQACCAFLDFVIDRDGDELVVIVSGPAEAGPVLDLLVVGP